MEKKSLTTLMVFYSCKTMTMKNHINLLDAFEIIKKQNKKVILLLIGKGTEHLKIQKNVISLGMKKNIEDYYSVGDIIVLPSKFGEGFSNVLAEGMLCKLFPVTTNVGDSKNIVSNLGVMIKEPNSKEIAKSIKNVLNLSQKEITAIQEKSRKKIL